jgi:hypothetical protein
MNEKLFSRETISMENSILKQLVRTIASEASVENSSDDSRPPDSEGPFEKLKQLGQDWLDRNLLWFMNFYPPYLGAGIRIDEYDSEFRSIQVKMDLNWWNQNYVGTQFGGSLYSMCDPFYMLMLINNLGPEYEVWDKSASIRFRKPGKGTVYARFELEDEDLERIRQDVSETGVAEPVFTVTVNDESGQTIAEVDKVLHVSKK